MTKSEPTTLILDAIEYVSKNRKSQDFQALEQDFGALHIRLATMEILWWLRYVYRGGRNRERWIVRGRGTLEAVSHLLQVGGAFSALFRLEGTELVWNSAIDNEQREKLVCLVGKSWTPRFRE